MEGISDIKIIGIDKMRPPMIRKAPYIDIVFKLSHKAPEKWCNDFNTLLLKHPSTPRIKEKEGLYIEAWVRAPDMIVDLLTLLKSKVEDCSNQYIERFELETRNALNSATSETDETSEQGKLNAIIAGLDFSDIKTQ